ncbi:hypothetical protein GUITHDRAFT_116362 [Guillardia theta CCMP2712]|uniref:Rotatin N-terminal domain-containing protein n=1 Tax=Guillardia theta (strain CCMP2712) TaxID=905079 RepID=L1IP08_GUITC|nr:hypothetical protein GUITHDRAFT_116362 [Guillardia theta CCMP2712]EKX37555.1 hypothetical protein GUITHDRAFT_116362 [Guillardia theta CCMP2712]|eukprot:XP_005824535.1 hypothetical protein GUITHDRAFT_116362 [Guillardia theta CCMP2712]
MEVSSLVRKLGHESMQIRKHAMSSILFKIKQKLICIPQLWEADLMIFPLLLEWFNYPNAPLQQEVLELVHSICSAYPDAASTFTQVGAIPFFQEMKRHCNIALKECVGSVLNILLSTPRNENLVKDVLIRSKVKGLF